MGKIGHFALFVLMLAIFQLFADTAMAGPPFVTDDPEPVGLRHWEFYVASSYNHGSDGTTGTAPHFEVNYGAATETQLHIIVPVSYANISGKPFRYGLGDVEVGVKYRFLKETSIFPQVGLFPLLELPSGDSSAGLGSGHTSAFLPIWFQKSLGAWTSYAGGGYWFNKTADGDKDHWQSGWQIQRDLSKVVTAGAEIFTQVARRSRRNRPERRPDHKFQRSPPPPSLSRPRCARPQHPIRLRRLPVDKMIGGRSGLAPV